MIQAMLSKYNFNIHCPLLTRYDDDFDSHKGILCIERDHSHGYITLLVVGQLHIVYIHRIR